MLNNDKKLAEQAKTDPQAFARLYDLYMEQIFRYVYRQLGNETWAQDVTAVTFEKALHHIQQYEWQGKSILAWLYRIARNEASSQQRKRKWLTPWRNIGQTEMRFTETAVLYQQRRQQIHTALSRLSAKDREIIQLRYFEELSSEETAAVLNCSTNNVYLWLHRALKRLQDELETMGINREVNYVSE